MKSILIVGSTGFVGQNFIEYLEKEARFDVSTLDRTKAIDSKLKSYTWEALSSIPFETIDHVFYFTGKAHDLKNTSDDQVYFDINVGLLSTFLNAAKENSFKGKFTFLSSVKAVADQVETILTEEALPNPITAYGKSKLEAEHLIAKSFIASHSFILRPCMIHGKGNKGNLNQLYAFVKKGIPNILYTYKNERSLLSVDNLIFVFDEITKGNLKEGTYQVADDQCISTNEIMSLMGEVMGKKVTELSLPQFVIALIAKCGDVLPLPINSDKLQKLTENYRVSNTKLVTSLNKQLPMTLKEGLVNTIKSFE